MSYLLIGDIHSQGSGLSKAIKHARERELRPIFLGDVFDSRCDNSDTIYVWNQLRVAQKELDAIVLNSNHQVRLRNFINADFESPSYTSETWRTLAEFTEAGVDMDDLLDWLSQRPDGASFRDKDGRLHCCAHAYFPLHWVDHEQEDGVRIFYSKDRHEEEQVVWGPHRHGQRRLRWWEDETSRSWVRCAGHYHTVYKSENNVVLDANSGYPDGRVPAYEVDTKELVYFS